MWSRASAAGCDAHGDADINIAQRTPITLSVSPQNIWQILQMIVGMLAAVPCTICILLPAGDGRAS